jgi:predicted amidohydrolase
LRNEAVFIDAAGNEIGSYSKVRLWNFDHCWFRPGLRIPVIATPFGSIGMMICADGRNPEIARTLAAQGAWLILDPTAWVGNGPSHRQIRNVQADFMLRVRALENGVWIAAADKCGSELGAVHYAGRSQIVAPDGSVRACADAAQPQLILTDIHRKKAAPFVAWLSAQDRMTLRKTSSHKRKGRTQRNGKAAVRVFSHEAIPGRFWLAFYQSAARRRDDPLALKALAVQGVQAVIRTGQSPSAILAALSSIRDMRVTLLEAHTMVAPEPARAAALRGADLLIWTSPPRNLPVLEIARTRAVENRLYVALCTRADMPVAACLIHPDGSIVGSALSGVPSGFVSAIDLIAARRKEVVPGTQTFADRLPAAYRWLDRASGVVSA